MTASPERLAALSIKDARAAQYRRGILDTAIVFWRGTSGHKYVHTIYSLTGCPEVPPACVLLVRRSEDGNRSVLKVMSVSHDAPSLNRAAIRHCAARLGANEVHLHFASGSKYARQTAVIDLRTEHSGARVVGE